MMACLLPLLSSMLLPAFRQTPPAATVTPSGRIRIIFDRSSTGSHWGFSEMVVDLRGNQPMRKNETKKLSLSRETIIRLNSPELGKVAGAGWSDDSVCPTTTP